MRRKHCALQTFFHSNYICLVLKKKILFLVPYPLGVAPSQRFRFEQYFYALEKNNIPFVVVPFLDDKVWDVLYQKGNFAHKIFAVLKGFVKRYLLLFSLSKYDYIFIHREAAPVGPPLLEWLIAKVFSKKIIFDFDDVIFNAKGFKTAMFGILKEKGYGDVEKKYIDVRLREAPFSLFDFLREVDDTLTSSTQEELYQEILRVSEHVINHDICLLYTSDAADE